MSLLVYKVKIELAQKSFPKPIKASLKIKPINMLKKPKNERT